MMKKIYMVPETAFEQFLKPFGVLMGSDTDPLNDAPGAGDPNIGGAPGAPKRKPF